jgi:hypothetical protein
MNYADLEKAIQVLLNPSGTEPVELKQQAQLYCDKLISENYSNWKSFFQLFWEGTNDYIKYWSLQALEQIIKLYYRHFPTTEKAEFHTYFFKLLEEKHDKILIKFFATKYCLIFIELIKHDFPGVWGNAFTQLISLLKLPAAENSETKLKFLGKLSTFLL